MPAVTARGLTIVLTAPGIIGALYGMNLALPLRDNPHAFLPLSGWRLVLSVGLSILLRKKDWL
jgi:Mg2+ and Co2+ transporter CorA